MLNIELARRLKGWSQGDLGSHPKVRIDRGFIGLIERGQALPIPEQAERIGEGARRARRAAAGAGARHSKRTLSDRRR